VTLVDTRQPLDLDALVERHHEADPRLERDPRTVEPVPLDGRLERLEQHLPPLGVDARHALADVGPVPPQRLQLEPDLRIAGREVLVEEAHRGAPALRERRVGRVHRALPRDQSFGEALEHPHEQVLHRAEVVVDEPVVGARLLGEPARRDPGVADVDQQALGGVEERLFGPGPGTGVDEVGQLP
jgi:hypothetical protein